MRVAWFSLRVTCGRISAGNFDERCSVDWKSGLGKLCSRSARYLVTVAELSMLGIIEKKVQFRLTRAERDGWRSRAVVRRWCVPCTRRSKS